MYQCSRVPTGLQVVLKTPLVITYIIMIAWMKDWISVLTDIMAHSLVSDESSRHVLSHMVCMLVLGLIKLSEVGYWCKYDD